MNILWWYLPVQSTAVCMFNTLSKLVTSLLTAPLVSSQSPSPSEVNHRSEKRKSEASSASSLLHHQQFFSEERGALASKHCFKFRGKSSLVIAQSKGCTHRSELDRQTRVRPQKTHPFPPAHTGTAPGSVPHTMQMGSDPIPSGKAKEASSEISGVSKS